MTTPQLVSLPATPQDRTDKSSVGIPDSLWKPLYKVGSAAALITAVFLPIQIIVFIIWPPPVTVSGWFTLFQNNKLVGLLDFDLLIVVDYILLVPILLALYVALKRISESFMAIAVTLWLVGIAAYFASNPAFAMLSLSDQYAVATTDAQRSMFLSAGQAIFATWQGTAFQVSYVLGSIAPIIISVIMLRSNRFSKVIAYAGILGNVIAFVIYVPTIGPLLSLISVVILEIWFILIARRFFQLSKETGA